MSDFNNGLSVAGTASFTGEIHAPGGSAVATNEAQGTGALAANTSGGSNTAQGAYALTTNNIGSNNTAQGYVAMQFNTSGGYNTAHGSNALRYNTTGTNNTALGAGAAYSTTSGGYNSAIGFQALYLNTIGVRNSAQGVFSLYSGITANYNCAYGMQALYDLGSAITAGAFVVGISYTILVPGTTDFTLIGAANSTAGTTFTATGVGSGTGTATPNANNNTAVGYNTGRGIVHGSNNTIIGANVTGLAAGLANNIIIADGAGNQRINVDAAGNFGLGAIPTAWSATAKAMQLGSTQVSFAGIGANTFMGQNWSYNLSNQDTYVATAAATRYYQSTGSHIWQYAPSGTAGAALSWSLGMKLDTSGNLGIGVIPKAWNTSFKAIDLGSYGSSFSARMDAIESSITSNSYRSAASGWVYAITGVAARYTQSAGAHYLYGAPSGTADAAVTFTQLLAVSKDNSLALQGATSQTGTGISFPATQSASTDPNTLDDYDEYNAASTACTGAITTSVAWKLNKIGNRVTLLIPQTLGTASAAASFTFGASLPAKYRPSADVVTPAVTVDSNSTLAAPGFFMVSAAGVITCYKEMTATVNFTAGNTSGCSKSQSISWIV